MSNEVIAIQNVHGYVDENGTVWLNAEDVARGLGWIQTQIKNGKEYTSIRWETINRHLLGFGFPQLVGEKDFIPENMLYRLAMKANNETAQKFQAKIADEILPQIRKTGMYKSEKLTPEFARQLIDQWEDAERRAKENLNAKMLQDCATINRIGYNLGKAAKCLNVKGLGRNKLFKFLRDVGILFYDIDGYNSVKQSEINNKRFFEYLDETYEYPVINITPKGMRYVLQKLVNEGYRPLMNAEEWERKCQEMQEEE